jgi:hypothetical protein
VVRARELLRATGAVRLEDGTTVTVDDATVASRITAADAAIDAAVADLAAMAELARGMPLDARAADARLRTLVGEHRARDADVSLIDVLSRGIARWLAGVGGAPPDPRIALVTVGGVGLALLLLVLAILGRDIRERFRREVVLPELRVERDADPVVHLRAAEDALRSGDLRGAIHALYLYAIRALAAHEAIRYDPSLTDREILARARTVPHADALRDLVALHELVWYGLREARSEDAARARSLALEASA